MPSTISQVLVGVATLTLVAPASAERALELGPGDYATVVTGSGPSAGVAWPDGGASLTPRWVVAEPRVRVACASGRLEDLVVRTERGPSAAPKKTDLRPTKLMGYTVPVSLYLWSLQDVRAACEGKPDGTEAALPSVAVKLELSCSGGERQKASQQLTLDVLCLPKTASQEARTGVAGTQGERQRGSQRESILRAARRETSASPREIGVGEAVQLDLGSLLIRTLSPPPKRVTPVRLDEAGKVVERFAPCFETGAAAATDDAECRPKVSWKAKVAGRYPFAFEVAYFDDSSVFTLPAQVRALTPEERAQQKALELSWEERNAAMQAFSRFVMTLPPGEPAAIEAGLADFVAKNPAVAKAGFNETGYWATFRDGRPFLVHRHGMLEPKRPKVASPKAWLEHMAAGSGARSDQKQEVAAFQRALAVAEGLGPDDPHVAASLLRLASALRHGGDFKPTIALYRRALAIEAKVLGKDHPKLLETSMDLALMLETTPEAESLLEQAALAVRQDANPDALGRLLGQLSDLKRKLGKPKEARTLDRRADALGNGATPRREVDVITALEYGAVDSNDSE